MYLTDKIITFLHSSQKYQIVLTSKFIYLLMYIQTYLDTYMRVHTNVNTCVRVECLVNIQVLTSSLTLGAKFLDGDVSLHSLTTDNNHSWGLHMSSNINLSHDQRSAHILICPKYKQNKAVAIWMWNPKMQRKSHLKCCAQSQ